jgi:hypothetical protein
LVLTSEYLRGRCCHWIESCDVSGRRDSAAKQPRTSTFSSSNFLLKVIPKLPATIANMRLLNIKTLKLEWFHSADVAPSYAILSHRWGDEEVRAYGIARHTPKRTRNYPSPKPTLYRFFSYKLLFFFFNDYTIC